MYFEYNIHIAGVIWQEEFIKKQKRRICSRTRTQFLWNTSDHHCVWIFFLMAPFSLFLADKTQFFKQVSPHCLILNVEAALLATAGMKGYTNLFGWFNSLEKSNFLNNPYWPERVRVLPVDINEIVATGFCTHKQVQHWAKQKD